MKLFRRKRFGNQFLFNTFITFMYMGCILQGAMNRNDPDLGFARQAPSTMTAIFAVAL